MHIYLHPYIHENVHTCIPHKDTTQRKAVGTILKTRNPFRVSCLLGIRSETNNDGHAAMAGRHWGLVHSVCFKISLMCVLLGLRLKKVYTTPDSLQVGF